MDDFTLFYDGGTVALLTPNNDAATTWVLDHLPDDTPRLGRSIGVEHRYIGDIIEGIQADGLSIQ